MLGGGPGVGGVKVNEETALGISAYWRAVSLISGTLASLPFPTYMEQNGVHKRVQSIFDNPDTDEGQTVFEWKETAFLHLLLHGKCGALKIRNASGGLARLALVHPLSFTERVPDARDYQSGGRLPKGGLWFDLTLADGRAVRYDSDDFWFVPGPSLDGRTGMSLLSYGRYSLGTTIAADQAAGRMFSNGAMISGIATPDDDEDILDDVPKIKSELNAAVGGWENAGSVAVVARRLKFTPWQMSAQDAQFLQSRQFQIEEIARWTGVPPHLLMQTEKQTSWGTGVEMQDRALGRTVLNTWASRFEQRASRLLPAPRWAEFDFAGLERPSPEKEIELLLAQTGKPIMTVNEARKVRNLGPIDGGDDMGAPAPAPAEDGEDDVPPAE